MFIIAVHYKNKDKKDIIGFCILDVDKKQIKDISYDSCLNALRKGIKIENLNLEDDKIVGLNGDISRYTSIVSNKVLNSDSVDLVILFEDEKESLYCVSNCFGNIVILEDKVILNNMVVKGKETKIANGKISSRNEEKFISAISGEYEKKDLRAYAKEKGYKIYETKKEIEKVSINKKKENNRGWESRIPKINYSKPEENIKEYKDINTGLTVEEKIVRVLRNLRGLNPYYCAVIECLKFRAVGKKSNVKTAAVSVDTLYYNVPFIASLDEAELTWTLMHEASHCIMGHIGRGL